MTVQPIDYLQEISNFIFTSKYARYVDEKKQRETWEQAIDRSMNMHLKKYSFLPKEDLDEIVWAFLQMKMYKVCSSMRSLQFGGAAIEAHNARIYNCAVRHIDSLRSFSEVFYLLLCGCGVGLGLSDLFLKRLPNLAGSEDKTGTVSVYTIDDSIEGWANSVEALLMSYFKNTPFTGKKIVFDYSKIRKKGAKLKTGGGKAPGYAGLKKAHIKIKKILDFIIEEQGQYRINSVNCYDILMHCADAVLSGGIRRAATSVMFAFDDSGMMNAKINVKVHKYGLFELDTKTGKYEGNVHVKDETYFKSQRYEVHLTEWELGNLKENNEVGWHHIYPQRARSNNSVLFLRDKVTKEQFTAAVLNTKQWGEPGFVFGDFLDILYNPCYEVGFRPVLSSGVCGVQFCNLTTKNGALIKTVEDYYTASKASAIIGTLQAGYTNFPFLGPASKELTEDEALLGCSMTGVMDNPDILLNPEYQRNAAKIIKDTNKLWAKKIGINQAARVTVEKPEGTSSIVVKSASGMGPHESHKYIRRVQMNKMDNVYNHFKKSNPHMTEESVWSANKTDDVISFPIVVPKTSMVKADLTALKHLEYIKSTQINYILEGATKRNVKKISNNVSCTVIVADDEWNDVIDYLYDNRKYFSAVSLLPKMGSKMYRQAPMESIETLEDEKMWDKIVKNYKHVDYSTMIENSDETNMMAEASCYGGACNIV
jgi:ribonucleoside-diphosphate reductase alpha chain